MFLISVYIDSKSFKTNKPYDYIYKEEIAFSSTVEINFNNRVTSGFVINCSKLTKSEVKYKTILNVINDSFLNIKQQEIVKYINKFYLYNCLEIFKLYNIIKDEEQKKEKHFNGRSLRYNKYMNHKVIKSEIYLDDFEFNFTKFEFDSIKYNAKVFNGKFESSTNGFNYKDFIFGNTIIVVDNIFNYLNDSDIFLSNALSNKSNLFNQQKININDNFVIYITPEFIFYNFDNIDTILVLNEFNFNLNASFIIKKFIESYNKLFKTNVYYFSNVFSNALFNVKDELKLNITYDRLDNRDLLFSIENLKRLQSESRLVIYCPTSNYSSQIICPSCGVVKKCRKCNIAYNFDKKIQKMKCKYCGYTEIYDSKCDICKDDLIFNNHGIDKIHEFVNLRTSKDIVVITENMSMRKQFNLLSNFYLNEKSILIIDDCFKNINFKLENTYFIFQSLHNYYYSNDIYSMSSYYHYVNHAVAIFENVNLQIVNNEYFDTFSKVDFFNKVIQYNMINKIQPFYNVCYIEIIGESVLALLNFIENLVADLSKYSDNIKVIKPLINNYDKFHKRKIVVKYKSKDINLVLKMYKKKCHNDSIKLNIELDKNCNLIY